MGTINYTISSGILPITVQLKLGSSIIMTNTHGSFGPYSFTNVTTASYTIQFTDTQGCTKTENIGLCNNCAPGFTPVVNGCLYLDRKPATYSGSMYNLIGMTYNTYSQKGMLLFNSGYLTNGTGTRQLKTSPYWTNPFPGNYSSGPLNRSAVWTNVTTGNQDIMFQYCINIAVEKTYYVGFGCDNYGYFKLNGTTIVSHADVAALQSMLGDSDARVPFIYWYIYPVILKSGLNILEIGGHNNIGADPNPGAVGIQIYDNTVNDILNATSDANLNILFNSKTKVGSYCWYENSPSGGIHGYTCPSGYALDTCDGSPDCVKRYEYTCGGVPPVIPTNTTTTTTLAPTTTTTTTAASISYTLSRIPSTGVIPRDKATVITIKLVTTGVSLGTNVAFTTTGILTTDIFTMKINGSAITPTLTGNFVVSNQGSYNGSFIELTFSGDISTLTKTLSLYLNSYPSQLVNVIIGVNVGSGYGKLYNWYAITGLTTTSIASTGWRVPTNADWSNLYTYLGGTVSSASGIYTWTGVGNKLKESGTVHWNSPNAATNSSLFTGRGSGGRSYGATYQYGSFYFIKNNKYIWELNTTTPMVNELSYNTSSVRNYQTFKNEGLSVRLVREVGTVGNGVTGSYTGNNQIVYTTIGIGTKEWLAEDLRETKYRNGVNINNITDNTQWHSATTGGYCSYNNDTSYD
jgi:uncharacterized protein (TIGR02145 family)